MYTLPEKIFRERFGWYCYTTYLYGIVRKLIINQSNPIMATYIQPISSFEDGNFAGAKLQFVSQDHKILTLTDGKEHYRVFRTTWDQASAISGYIKLGQKNRVYSQIPVETETKNEARKGFDPATIQSTLLSTVNVDPKLYRPVKTGTDIDSFWSRKGGVMPGTNTMITGDPGIGKSSVMMDVLQGIKVTDPDMKVLYVSAEMTRIDMLDPDEFMKYYPNLFDKVEFIFAADYLEDENGPTFSQALEVLLGRGYDVVVFDSMIEVQGVFQEEMELGSGRHAEKYMLQLMQRHNQAQNDRKVYTAFLLIQQVKKDGEFVGSKRLEHMITAFLRIKWCAENRGKKYMEFRKNRRGEVKLKLYFKLGNGVEYDIAKLEEEKTLRDILTSNDNIANELSELELAQLLTGGKRKNEVEETEDDEDEN